jgi:hypothetical protein
LGFCEYSDERLGSIRAGVHAPTKSVSVPATPSINTPDWCAEQMRTRLTCDLTLFCSADSDFVGACTSALKWGEIVDKLKNWRLISLYLALSSEVFHKVRERNIV